MSLVHSDSASTSGSSGLCRCLVWDSACDNICFGLLISGTVDAYRFDLRKLIKGPALPTCSVVQYLDFFQHRIGLSSESSLLHRVHSQGMMDAFSSLDISRPGGLSVPVKLKNCGFGALK